MTKPVRRATSPASPAPPGKTMGHAGAIISGSCRARRRRRRTRSRLRGVIGVGTTPTEWLSSGQPSAIAVQASILVFARGAGARTPAGRGLADCAQRRCCSPTGEATVLSYGSWSGYGPLREWIARAPRRRGDSVLVTNGGLAGLSLLRASSFATSRRRACFRRAADVRPAAQDPARARRARSPLAPMDEEAWLPMLEARARGRPEAGASLYTIPTFQNPSGRTLFDRAAGATSSSIARASEAARRSRTIRIRARPLRGRAARRRCFALEAANTSCTLRRSRRPSRRACASATSSCRRALHDRARGDAVVHLHLARSSRTGDGATSSSVAATSSRTSSVFVSLLAPAGTPCRCAPRSELAGSGAIAGASPAGGYFVWLDVPGRRRRELPSSRASAAGVTFVQGADFRRRRRASTPPAYSYVSPDGDPQKGVPSPDLALACEPAAAPL